MSAGSPSQHPNISVEHANRNLAIMTATPQRLEVARERIRAACAERNYFSPAFQLATSDSSETFMCPPDPDQVLRDLQTLFEKFLALDSFAADAVYEDISLKVWEMANDEHLCFDWETFQETAGKGVRGLREKGYRIDFPT